MPTLKVVWPLSAAFIERAHDFGIDLAWPDLEPVHSNTCRAVNLLYSAAAQPYQSCFEHDCYPTLASKAAYLFCHLTTAHVFTNGNKRTAVLCLDSFLLANAFYLTLENLPMYRLATEVASYGERGQQFEEVRLWTEQVIDQNMIPFSAFRTEDPVMYRRLHRSKYRIRNIYFNRLNYPLQQFSD